MRSPFKFGAPQDPEQHASNGSAPYYVRSDDGSRVDIVKHARSAGLENLPESAAHEPNDVETAIQREHERRHRDLLERTRGELSSLTTTFNQTEQRLPTTRDLHVAVEQARAAAEHDLAADHATTPLRHEQQRRRRSLRNFIVEHQPGREAAYPPSRIWHFSLVAVVVVIESLLNMSLLARASVFGLVGGLFVAIGVSAINALIGLLAGFFSLRWRHHHEMRLQRLATIGIAAYVVVLLIFNWVVARYRDAAASGADRIQLSELFHHSASLTIHSAALFLIGILASLIALRKGYTADDRIPHFGDHDRAFRVADREFAEHIEVLQQRVLGHVEGVPRVCDGITQRAAADVAELGRLVARMEQGLEAYEAGREQIARWSHQHLRRYRSENEAVRTTPVPQYFGEYQPFDSQLSAESIASCKARLGPIGGKLDELKQEAQRIALEQPKRVEAAGQRFATFLRDVLRGADAGRGDGSANHAPSSNDREEVAS